MGSPASGQPVKALFAGPVLGQVDKLVARASNVNAKVQADVLFCVGPFFTPGDSGADPDDYLVSLATGDVEVPLMTYFLGGWGAGAAAICDALPASDCKLRYLGRAGVTKVSGLTVAYLDGTYHGAAYLNGPAQGGDNARYSPYYTQADVAQLKTALSNLEGEVDILLTCEWPKDIAAGVPPNLAPDGDGGQASRHGSHIAAELSQLARPRYHFAAGPDCHFARLPYTNRDLGAGARATRFIALAPQDSASRAKSLHALSLVPAAHLDPEVLSAVPEGSTPCPYDIVQAQWGQKRAAQEEALPEGQDWRWNMGRGRGRGRGAGRGPPGGRGPGDQGPREPAGAPIQGRVDVVRDPYATVVVRNVPFRATQTDIVTAFTPAGKVVDVIRGAGQDGRLNAFVTVQFADRESAERAVAALQGHQLLGRPISLEPATAAGRKPAGPVGQAVAGCWFCLGSEGADLGLVASVGEEAYLALDKGPITEQHVLVVPVDHYPSAASLSPTCYAEVERFLVALKSMLAAQGKEMVAFERYLTLRKSGGNHCHINVVGISLASAKSARQVFETSAQAAGFPLTEISSTASSVSAQAALQAAVGQCEYFLAVLPDGTRLVRPIMRDERFPMSLGRDVLAQLAGVPERADWKKCSGTPAEEEARAEKFKQAFKAFDIMLS